MSYGVIWDLYETYMTDMDLYDLYDGVRKNTHSVCFCAEVAFRLTV
jgi:hypothetical protein